MMQLLYFFIHKKTTIVSLLFVYYESLLRQLHSCLKDCEM